MKKIIVLALGIIIAMSLVGCNAGGGTISVKDSRGEAITLKEHPKKIVSLIPSSTEDLYAIGAGDKVIAVSEYCDYPSEANSKPKLPTGEKINIEQIVALKPDAVFMGKMAQTDDQIKQIEAAGIKVFVFDSKTLEDVYSEIIEMGKITGNEKNADAVVKKMKKDFSDVKASVKDVKVASAYIEIAPLQYGPWTAGKNTFMSELFDIANIKNVFGEIDGWKAISEEQVIKKNPENIITTVSLAEGVESPVMEIKSRKNWSKIDGVKNDRVFQVENNKFVRPGPRLSEAAKDLVKLVYGK